MGKYKTKTSSDVKNRYNEQNYDRIGIFVPLGMKAAIVEYAKNNDGKTNTYITRLIREDMGLEYEEAMQQVKKKKEKTGD